MNYFERLVRRALLRPASAPGAALDDPFAAVAELPLETPPAPAAAPRATSVPDDAASVERIVERRARAAEQAGVVVAGVVPDATPPSAERSASQMPSVPRQTVPASPVPRAIEARAPDETPVAPPPEALALADAFMRSLGVQSQLPEAAPEARREAAAIEPATSARRDEEPVQRRPRAEVAAPTPLPLPLPPAARKDAPDRPETRRQKADELLGQAPTTARTIVETRHVVVERASATATEAALSGGGAPRFGLGQL